MPQLDITTYSSQIVWLAITFGAMFLVMWRIAVPKISDALEARQKRMDDHLERAAELKHDAEAAIAAYEKALSDARSEAHMAIIHAHEKLNEETAAREDELNHKIETMISDHEDMVEKAVQDAVGNIRDAAKEVAAAAVERVLGEQVQPADVGDAVDAAMKARS